MSGGGLAYFHSSGEKRSLRGGGKGRRGTVIIWRGRALRPKKKRSRKRKGIWPWGRGNDPISISCRKKRKKEILRGGGWCSLLL